MKRLVSVTMFAICLVAVAPRAGAQDCSNWNNWSLRGTYAKAGSGWIDLSKLVPALPAGIPAGTVPMSWVGAHMLDGKGGGTGWVSVNAGGVQLNMQLVGLTYQVKADCSMLATFSLKIKELGITIGPVARLLVIGGKPDALELYGMFLGGGPGMPVDLFSERRISMQCTSQP